ncbi:MAG TPA: hypothetical protein DHV48_20185 [Prolixibacteraceae bacterium]|nr:hypothetical protein [Prolixibacteraceae bacterium]
MMNMRQLLLILISILGFQAQIHAQTLSPDANISILTCNPGTEVYSMYGHTAIRVSDPATGLDAVFNYGVFSFEAPNFLYRFAKGQTDYLMVGQKFSSFLPEYEKDKRSVYEQVLNLSPEGKIRLFEALLENARPENREYRYNFFMDNCATRVRDMIERNAAGTIRFNDDRPTKTYRDLIKEFHHSFRWIDLGIDLLVGKKADEPVSASGQMFLPEYLQNQFVGAEITIDGKTQPLVLETRTLVEYPNTKLNSNLPWPAIVFGLLFLLVAGISIRDYFRKKNSDWLDYWLFGLTGFAGLIIGWFTLYSEHPAMSPNYNLLWAFPLNLFFAFVWRFKKWRTKTKLYFWLIGALLLISFVAGQQLNPAVYFIILTLLVRVGVNLAPERK